MTASLDGQSWGISDAAALVAEIDRDLGERQASYPELVRKGRLNAEEGDYLLSVVRDIREDLLFAFAPLGDGEIRETWERGDWRVTWANKVRWIDLDLTDCRQRFPELVAKGRLDGNAAQRRIGALEHLRRLYWNNMFQWQPPEGPALDYLKANRAQVLSGAGKEARDALFKSEGAKLYRETVRRHMAAVEAEDAEQGRLVA
jgi:hypothetical protein